MDEVAHHQANGQYNGHERKHIDGEAGDVHDKERRNDRDRNGNNGNDGRAPVAEESKDNERYQHKCYEQGFFHFHDSAANLVNGD